MNSHIKKKAIYFFIFIFFISFFVGCKKKKTYNFTQYKFKYYRVKKGDSLWNIANKYGVTIQELKKVNHLKTNNLKVGQIIKIPIPKQAKKIVKNTRLKLQKINLKVQVDAKKHSKKRKSRISFIKYKEGLFIFTKKYAKVYASVYGKVIYVGKVPYLFKNTKTVIIEVENKGFYLIYSNLYKVTVKLNQRVKPNYLIGIVSPKNKIKNKYGIYIEARILKASGPVSVDELKYINIKGVVK